MPRPEIAALEQNLQQLLRPEDFLPIRQSHRIPKTLRRDRLLTLPVILAVVLGLIYRKIPGLAATSRVRWNEGLLWVAPLQVSRQALSRRLMDLPVRYFAEIFEQVLQYFQQKPPPSSVIGATQLRQGFSTIWIADGSTLEELRKRLKSLADQDTVLAGWMMVVGLFTHRPVASWYTSSATTNRPLA
jgi:hypothetical protein